MKTGTAILLGIVALFAAGGCSIISMGVSFNNTAIRMENGIEAQYTQNQNNYDNYFKQLKEASQVPEMYATDLKNLWDSVMRGRYQNSAQVVFSWIKEHNPKVDSRIYRDLTRIVTSGRKSFEADQRSLIDKKREYKNYRETFPNSLYAGFLGFPKINLSKYDIVTSEETERAFDTKKSEPLKLRDK